MRRIILIFTLLLISSLSFSQVQTAKIDSLLNILDSRGLAFGSLAISQDDKMVYQKAIGYAYINDDKRVASTPETHYKIGSVTKMLTATIVFQLIEERKLTLDQKLSDYFPGQPNAARITLGEMLTHQSGLHDYTNDTGFEAWMNKPQSKEELLKLIREKGPDFQPGERNEYSNSNYLLLGYIIEKITGKTYEENVSTRITSKISLKDTYLAHDVRHPSASVSYKYGNGKWNTVSETNPGIHSGAGALISTPADLAKFISSLFSGKLINKTSLRQMTTMVNDFGSGIFPYDHGTIKGYGHNGRIEEFYTAVRYFPEHKIALAYCTNGINYPRVDILESILKSCFSEAVKLPLFSVPVTDLRQYAGTYEAAQMPVVTILIENARLVAETQGARFELEPVAENYFMHSYTGYYFEFVPGDRSLRIKETDNVYFLKQK